MVYTAENLCISSMGLVTKRIDQEKKIVIGRTFVGERGGV